MARKPTLMDLFYAVPTTHIKQDLPGDRRFIEVLSSAGSCFLLFSNKGQETSVKLSGEAAAALQDLLSSAVAAKVLPARHSFYTWHEMPRITAEEAAK